MKVCILTSLFPPKHVGGAEIGGYNIAKHLSKKHDVHVVTRSDKDVPRFKKENGFYIHTVNCGKIPLIKNVIEILDFFLKVIKLKPDLIYAETIYSPGIVGAMANKIFGIPTIVQSIGVDVYRSPFFYKKTLARFVLKNSNLVLYFSKDMKKEIMDICPEAKTNLLLYGINHKEFSEGEKIKVSHPAILFVGRLLKVKGVKYLVKAFGDVVKVEPKCKLYIVGDGPELRNLTKLIDDLGIKNSVIFIGRKSQKEVAKYMRSCDIFVLPSLSEALGIVILEAMAAGLPIIASDICGMREKIKNDVNGFLFKKCDDKELAEKIIYLMQNENVRKKIKENNLKESKKYDWTNVVERLEKLMINLKN